MRTRAAAIALALSVFGCATNVVTMRYEPDWSAPKVDLGAADMAVSGFADARSQDVSRIGTIRGGYGNPLVRMRTPLPVQDVVEEAFSDAFRAHRLLAEGSSPRFEVSGRILRFDCDQLYSREAHAHLDVTIRDLQSGETMSVSVRQDAVRAGGDQTGEMLRQLLEEVLRGAVDRVIFDPDLAVFRNRAP